MSDKATMLARIREALKVEAPLPGHHDDGVTAPPKVHAAQEFSRWLAQVGPDLESQLALFAQNSNALKTDFQLLPPGGDIGAKLREISLAQGWKKVGTHSGFLTDPAVGSLGITVVKTDPGYAIPDLENCDAGISECDALVAQTGSVLITSQSAGGRSLWVFPPHHVVLVRRSQMVPDLPAAYALLKEKYQGSYPSLISFITGPSRTGDIERILVLGAHGPKQLTVICG